MISTSSFVNGISYLLYEVNTVHIEDSPLSDDDLEFWFGSDFLYLLDSVMDDHFSEVESDLLTIWSTNRSE